MIENTSIRRWLRPEFGRQPEPRPQSPMHQLAHQPTASRRHETDPPWPIVWQRGRRRLMQVGRGTSPLVCFLDPRAHRHRPQHGNRQYQPVAGDPLGVTALPSPADTLQHPEAELDPDAQAISRHSDCLRRPIGQDHPARRFVRRPNDDHRRGTAALAEGDAAAHPGVPRSGNQRPGGTATCPVG